MTAPAPDREGRGPHGAPPPLTPATGSFTPRRVLLVECLDAAGARAADAAARSDVWLAAGCAVRTLVISEEHAGAVDEGADLVGFDRMSTRHAIEEAVASADADLVVVASAARGGGIVGEFAARTARARWWPAAVGEPRTPPRPGPLAPLTSDPRGRSIPGGREFVPPGTLALELAVHTGRAPSGSSPWERPYVIAPIAPSGESGTSVLRMLAELDAEWNGIDLIVPGRPQLETARLADAAGVGGRVHFVRCGEPGAEARWIAAARGAVLAADVPLSAALVLRCLAARTPVLAMGSPGAIVNAWLAERRAVPGGWADAGLTDRERLEHLLRRDREIAKAVTAGAALAEVHRPRPRGRRLAGTGARG